MKTLFTAALLVLLSGLPAKADLKETFDKMGKSGKGAFGLNYQQGTHARVAVKNGGPPAGYLFLAAFRNEIGRELAEQYSFYVGNLFTTNYYELMGEYVYQDAYGSHPIDEDALKAQAAAAMPKAVTMVKSWVMEKHYIEHFPASALAKGFTTKGISGAEFEQPYAARFFDFYLGAIDGEYQYLPAFLLVQESPIVDSPSLAKARDMIASTFTYFEARFATSDPRLVGLKKIRNAIHNQLSRDVIAMIDKYLNEFPYYLIEHNTYLPIIKKILVDYYSFRVETIGAQAEKLGMYDLKASADRIGAQGANPDTLLELSRIAANWRTDIANPAVLHPLKRAAALALLAKTTQFLNRELTDSALSNKLPNIIEAVVNTVYVEGFLIKDNWEFYQGEAATTTDPGALLSEVLDVSSGGPGSTLYEAFSPVYDQWVSVEPEMEYFMDNTIKSSALNTVAILSDKLKGR